jgi:hypothetical protein
MPVTRKRLGRIGSIVVVSVLAGLCVAVIHLSRPDPTGRKWRPQARRAARATAPSNRIASELIGKWKCEGEVVTDDDGSQRHIPYTGVDEDLELFDNGQFVDGKEGSRGEFTILDSTHVQFKILSASRQAKGPTYMNEFSLSGDRLTLSITKNPPGISRHEILYTKR